MPNGSGVSREVHAPFCERLVGKFHWSTHPLSTDLAVAISNQCGRLIANAIIYYNSALLSFLLQKYQASDNLKGVELIKKISPVAWQHTHLLGHYTFRSGKHMINLEEIVANLILEKIYG